MARSQHTAVISSAMVALSSFASAGTWIVDDDGGPGVDFLTVAEAVAVANGGDVIVVSDGQYPQDITTNKSITILGSGLQTRLNGSLTFRHLPRGKEVRLAGFFVESLSLEHCLGPVLGTELRVGTTSPFVGGTLVLGCANVRLCDSTLYGSTFAPGVFVDASRAEFSQCVIVGGDGADGVTGQNAQQGTEGLITDNRAIVSVAPAHITGGNGGWSNLDSSWYGGGGNTGLLVRPTSRVYLSGGGVSGGDGGLGVDFDYDGAGGDGVHNFGWISRSNTGFYYGFGGFDLDGYEYIGTGALIEVDPPRPLLEVSGGYRTNGAVQLSVHAAVGDHVHLLIGENAMVGTQVGVENSLLLKVDRTIPLGPIPASGELNFDFDVPAGTSPGDLIAVQALVSTTNGDCLTNSAPLVIR